MIAMAWTLLPLDGIEPQSQRVSVTGVRLRLPLEFGGGYHGSISIDWRFLHAYIRLGRT
jgi:hypothetical protein